MECVAMSYELYSTWILTKKGCFSILEIVLLNATIRTYSVNQLLISWNMHGLPAGTLQGALVSRGCCLIRRRHPNYALLQIGSLCLQPSTLQQKLSHGITAQKFQTVNSEIKNYTLLLLFLYHFYPCGSEGWLQQRWFKPVLAGRYIPVVSRWTDLQKSEHPQLLLSSSLVVMEANIKPVDKTSL